VQKPFPLGAPQVQAAVAHQPPLGREGRANEHVLRARYGSYGLQFLGPVTAQSRVDFLVDHRYAAAFQLFRSGAGPRDSLAEGAVAAARVHDDHGCLFRQR
jgi:hypothetical protein